MREMTRNILEGEIQTKTTRNVSAVTAMLQLIIQEEEDYLELGLIKINITNVNFQ